MTDNTTGWELLSAWPGGTVSALATTDGPGGHGAAITLAATAAGLHVSRDGGQTWRWIALGPAPVTDALAVSPRFEADRTVLIGTNAGLHRSTDGGLTWRAVLADSRVQCIAATPDFAEGGPVLVGTEADGVLRSEDGGLSWDGGSAGLLDLNVTALALSPTFGRDRTAFAGTTSGLYRSRNSGRAWRLVEIGLEVAAIQALAVSPAFQDDGLVLAGTEQNGLLRSDDGGQSWASVTAFPEPCVTSLTFRPAAGSAPAIIVVGTAAGVVISRDGGRSWLAEAPDLGPILSLAGTGDAILAGTIDHGVVRRVLGGAEHAAWTPANDGLAGRATVGLAVTLAFGTEPLFGVAMLDGGVLISHDDARSWRTGHIGLTDPAASSLAFVRRPGGQPALLTVFPDGLYWSDQIESGWQRIDLPASDPSTRMTVVSLVSTPAAGPSTVLAAGIRTL
ncbi:MAG: WD40/YVTN/BNR-like repeat-containing protein, partial [Chloroflexota bacterium]